MKFNNQDKVNYKQARSFTVKELQEIYDSFDKDSKPTAQGFLDYLSIKIIEGGEK